MGPRPGAPSPEPLLPPRVIEGENLEQAEHLEYVAKTPTDLFEYERIHRDEIGVDLPGHTKLAEAPDLIPHLPHNEALPGLLAISGRVCDVNLELPKADDTTPVKRESLCIADLNWAPGEIYRQVEIQHAQHEGRYTPMEHVTAAFAIFIKDTGSESEGNQTEQADKWRLVSALTTADAHPLQGYVNTVRHIREPGSSAVTTTEQQFLLSNYVRAFDDELREQFSADTYQEIVDGLIRVMGDLFNPAVDDYDPTKRRLAQDLIVDREIKRLLESYLKGDPFTWRVPLRAGNEYAAMEKFSAQQPNSTPALRRSIAERKDLLRHQVVQALAITTAVEQLKAEAEHRARQTSQPAVNELCWHMMTLDAYDRAFAAILAELPGGPLASEAHAAAKKYAGTTQWQLLVEPNLGNQLLHRPTLSDDHTGETTGAFGYSGQPAKPAQTPHGALPTELISSLEQSGQLPQLGGIVDQLRTVARAQNIPGNILIVDLLRAPGKLFKQLVDNDLFTNPNAIIEWQPSLYNLLCTQMEAQYVVLENTAQGPLPKAIGKDGQAFQLYLSADKQSIGINNGRVITEHQAWTKAGEDLKRRERRRLDRAFRVDLPTLSQAEIPLLSFATHNGTLQARAHQRNIATIMQQHAA